MESLLGFKEPPDEDVVVEDKSCGYKLVPWLSWDEWDFVRQSLFSSSPLTVASALRRISAWRSRGCVPVVIEVTASMIEIQQKDPFFRDDLTDYVSQSEEMLAMLYCMGIMRLVNGVVEKMRKKTEVSIAEAADAIGIPRMLIDIRHEGSHRDLPSLRLVRLACIKALDWLNSYYWEPQKKAIAFQNDRMANVKKEIKSILCELASCLKAKQTIPTSSSLVKGKRTKHCERLYGRNKFFSIMAGKPQFSKSSGSKKQVTKTLKNFLRLHSSFSSEVVSVLLEFLLDVLDSSDLVELSKSSQVSYGTVFEDWKPVIVKLSNREPELLLNLLKAVLDMIETCEAMKYETGREQFSSNSRHEFRRIEQLSFLFEWLLGNLKGLKHLRLQGSAAETNASSTEPNMLKATLAGFLRKCLLVSSPGNNKLLASAIVLGQMTGNSYLVEKLNKLSSLGLSNPDFDEYTSSLSSESFLSQQEDSLRQAAEKLEVIKFCRMKGDNVKTADGDVGNKSRWVVAKSWKPCPIGMLPGALGSSGQLPVLDCNDDNKELLKSSERRDHWELNQCSGKREADCAIEHLDNSNVKKMRECEAENSEKNRTEETSLEGVKGQLMIGGIWKKVREEDLLAIASALRILV